MSTAKRLVTHSETFHTDDVFATAMLLTLFPDANVTRSRNQTIIDNGDIVYDVGQIYDPARQRFDHHQVGAARRPNGITYCGFGLVWKEHGVKYCGGDAELARHIDEQFVTPIDANDNGQNITNSLYLNVEPFTIDSIIKSMNPLLWLDDSETYDSQFMEAVRLAQTILARVRQSAANSLAAQKAVVHAYQTVTDKRMIILDKPASVSDVLAQCPELLYVISPRPGDAWGVLAVPNNKGSYDPRRPFPQAWRAQSGDVLARLSGVPDAVFCHATGFLAVASSCEGATALVRQSLGNQN